MAQIIVERSHNLGRDAAREKADELAARQPEDQWTFRANWQAHDYQARLRG